MSKNPFNTNYEAMSSSRGGVTESEGTHLTVVVVYEQQQVLKFKTKVHCFYVRWKKWLLAKNYGKATGKSGAGFIKSVGMEGVTQVYTWTAQMKGVGKAKGVDCNLNVTGKSMSPPKGIAWSKDQGMMMTMTGEMGIVKGVSLMKMTMGKNPTSVGLWTFMTMSEKLGWLNDTIAVVTFEATDPMWTELNIAIWEWK